VVAMKRIALLLALLLFFLSVTAIQSLEQNAGTISSYGIVNSGEHKLWWGAGVSDTAWASWGSFFGKTQIDILKQFGSTAVRILLDKKAWDTNDTGNVLGLPYPDYIKRLVAWCKPELKVLLDLTKDSATWIDDFGWAAKKEIITTSALRTAWINWGKAVISYCNPDAIGIMNEPGGQGQTTTFDYYYDNFVTPSINAYCSVNPNIIVFVMGMPFWDLSGFVTRPIADSKVIYQYHFYYNYPIDPSGTSQLYYNMSQAYGESRLAYAKSYLTQYLNWKFSGLPKTRINMAELGVMMTKGQTVPSKLNWDAFLIDSYDYAKQYLAGSFQWGFTKAKELMLDPSTSYTTLTPYGQLWAQECPV
jgi:hypothetical protein